MKKKKSLPYLTGFILMDQQHDEILEIIAVLTQYLSTNESQSLCLESCSSLVNALRQHYDDEERFMLKSFYPDIEGHIGQHMAYLNHFGKLVSLIRSNQLPLALSTLKFMRSWILDHMNDADKKYADFIHHQSA